jgi:hypothetical protein
MLKITKVVEGSSRTASLTVDDYVPFIFRADDQVLASPLLWRTGDFKSSLLEVKIEANTGCVRGVTLTLFSGRLEATFPKGYAEAEVIEGLPVVETAGFPGGRFEEPNAFHLFRAGNDFLLLFDARTTPTRCIRASRLGFFEADGSMCGIGFFGLSPEEVVRLTPMLHVPS